MKMEMVFIKQKKMIKYGGLLLALSGAFMPYENNFQYAIGGVIIFVGTMIFLNTKHKEK